jgi:AcrR family transcriptional regulator
MRVTKDPEVRRRELIEIAEKLFLERGYENVTVSDIVRTAGVAQGTFYYYFESKEAMLSAITDKTVDFLIKRVWDIANDKHLSGVQKLVSIFGGTPESQRRGITKVIEEPANAHLHFKFEGFPDKTNEPITQIIKQGIAEGTFNTPYPEEAARAYLGIFLLVLQGADKLDPKSEALARKGAAAFDFIEKILGASPGVVFRAFMEINSMR